MTVVIELPILPAPVDELWHTLLDLSESLEVPWALIGGQMVLLHALENGQVPPQISQDGDVIADIRAVPGALTHVVSGIERLGFALQSISADGLAHRYTRAAEPRPVVIDVLAPEGLGARADLTTTPPGRTIEVPGGAGTESGGGNHCRARRSPRHDPAAHVAGSDRRQGCGDSTASAGASLPGSRAALRARPGPVRARRATDPKGPATAAAGKPVA